MINDRRKTRRPDQEAAAWFTLLSDTEVENEDLEAFGAWVKRDENRAAYRRVEDISQAARALRDDPDMRAAARDALARPVTPPRLGERLADRSPRFWGGLALAGALASAATLWVIAQPRTYQTEVGERLTAHLADGSTLQLNTDTRLRVKLTGGERRIELVKGQAFFDVAHDAARPFVVRAGPMQVRALGTRFDVRREGPGAAVTLAQGRVGVRPDRASADAWTLAPGQRLRLGPDVAAPRPLAVDVAAETGWLSGQVTFHDVALAEAVAEMNRYERAKIVIAPGAPAAARVSGVFLAGDEQDFVAAVAANFDLVSTRRPDGSLELHPPSGGR